jgi:hypothetical protein
MFLEYVPHATTRLHGVISPQKIRIFGAVKTYYSEVHPRTGHEGAEGE